MGDKFFYTTPKEQIEKLKQQHLIFEDEHIAYEILDIYGYYNVINSYNDAYITIDKNNNKTYKDGTTFEQIFSLFTFDHYLRVSTMTAMLDVEELLRAAVADVLASSFGTDHRIYLLAKNYRNRRTKDPRFSLKEILKTFNETIDKSKKDPLFYYKTHYDTIPPWILFKNVYLATLVNFIIKLKPKERTALMMKVYGIDEHTAQLDALVHIFYDTLHICREYRNLSAHGGRIYNYTPSCSCRVPDKESLLHLSSIFPDIGCLSSNYGISLLAPLLEMFKYKQPFLFVHNEINTQINRHCNKYPQDVEYLAKVLGVTINVS